MKKSLRHVIYPLVLIALVAFFWHWNHSALSDEQQIQVALDGLAGQVSHKSAGGVTFYLAKDFQLDGVGKKELRQQLTAGLVQYAIVNMKVTSSQVKVDGDTATSTGHYDLDLKPEFNSPEQKYPGEFQLKWKREDGQWKISNADGNKLPPGLAGG